jgi:hypothetical protein
MVITDFAWPIYQGTDSDMIGTACLVITRDTPSGYRERVLRSARSTQELQHGEAITSARPVLIGEMYVERHRYAHVGQYRVLPEQV